MSETPEAEVVAWRVRYVDAWWLYDDEQEAFDLTAGQCPAEPLVPLAAYQSAIQERDAARQQVEYKDAAHAITKAEAAHSLARALTAEASNASLRQQLDGVREAAQNVYDKLASETATVTILDQEALGDALKSSEPKE